MARMPGRFRLDRSVLHASDKCHQQPEHFRKRRIRLVGIRLDQPFLHVAI